MGVVSACEEGFWVRELRAEWTCPRGLRSGAQHALGAVSGGKPDGEAVPSCDYIQVGGENK